MTGRANRHDEAAWLTWFRILHVFGFRDGLICREQVRLDSGGHRRPTERSLADANRLPGVDGQPTSRVALREWGEPGLPEVLLWPGLGSTVHLRASRRSGASDRQRKAVYRHGRPLARRLGRVRRWL